MIEFSIFGEFFENPEGSQGCHFTSSYLFSTPENDLKKITHQYHDNMYL